MVQNIATDRRLNSTFAALADPTRRAILTRLAAGPASVTELAHPFEISLPAVSNAAPTGISSHKSRGATLGAQRHLGIGRRLRA